MHLKCSYTSFTPSFDSINHLAIKSRLKSALCFVKFVIKLMANPTDYYAISIKNVTAIHTLTKDSRFKATYQAKLLHDTIDAVSMLYQLFV